MNIDEMEYDATAREIVGKSIADCTEADLVAIQRVLRSRAAREQAIADQMFAVLKDAEDCGCRIAAPVNPDGSTDFYRGTVIHTCGKRGGRDAD